MVTKTISLAGSELSTTAKATAGWGEVLVVNCNGLSNLSKFGSPTARGLDKYSW